MKTTSDEKPRRGRPPAGPESARHHLHIRLTGQRKGSYVRAARERGEKLSQWILRKLDEGL